MGGSRLPSTSLDDIEVEETARVSSGIEELDRVLGGGIVPGSVTLMGGPPGIGKSTLLLQWADRHTGSGDVLYLHGEESAGQIARRAERIGVETDRLRLLHPDVIEQFASGLTDRDPELVFIDSIQTVVSEESGGMPGSVSQLRAVGQAVVSIAKRTGIPFVMTGHVTKEGKIGGPKVLEHMVDTVLYFDDARAGHRFIRSAKNRFGSTGELGIFEMTGSGLEQITDPGQYFCGEEESRSGSVLTISLEGTRPLLVEVQALVSPSRYGTPQRSTTGYPRKRLSMVLAVLEKHVGMDMGTQDVYVNVAGGLSLDDPGADLAVALAAASSYEESHPPDRLVALGEVGLTGELRSPGQLDQRIRELRRLPDSALLIGGGSAPDSHEGDSTTAGTVGEATGILL